MSPTGHIAPMSPPIIVHTCISSVYHPPAIVDNKLYRVLVVAGSRNQSAMRRFKMAVSDGFDPEQDLVAIGLANQTTMLRNETTAIGKLLEKTMMEKYGPAELKQHYMVMDTICDATQVCALAVISCPPRSEGHPSTEFTLHCDLGSRTDSGGALNADMASDKQLLKSGVFPKAQAIWLLVEASVSRDSRMGEDPRACKRERD